jgi:hypothetical protein
MITAPTTQSLAQTIEAQIGSSLGQTIPPLAKAFIPVLSLVLAGAVVILYKYAGFIFLQLFVAHATMEPTTINGKVVSPLKEWGRLFGVGDPLPAQQAQHTITVLVTNQTGALPGGTQLLNPKTEVLYTTISAVPLNAASVPVRVRASGSPGGGDGSGVVGNMNPGEELEFTSSPPNVSRVATIASTEVQGADAETTDAYRAKIFRRAQAKPQGGAYADYRAWGTEVAGVVEIYPYAADQPGVVDVYVEVETGVDADGIAPVGYQNAVYDAIQLNVDGVASRRPIGAAVAVKPITRTPIDVFVRGLNVDAAVRPQAEAEMIAAIEEHLLSRRPFIEGLDALPREDRVTVADLGGVVSNVAATYGGTVTKVELEISGAPQTAYTLGKGEKVKKGNVDLD